MQTVLKRDGYTVHTAENAIIALELFDVQHIDLIVLDIMMPGGMDGYEFTEELRQSGNMTPILMTTAKQLPADKISPMVLLGACRAWVISLM